MAKVISLDDYVLRKKKKRPSSHNLTRPIWFHEISNGIKALALRDRELIFENIKYNYYDEYLYFINVNKLSVNGYTFENYLKDYIILKEPFEIVHGIEFSKGYDLNHLSKNDWENIADIIVRISLFSVLFQEEPSLEPIMLADQYKWDSIDFTY